MSVTSDALLGRLNASAADSGDEAARVLGLARIKVAKIVADCPDADEVPDEILDEAVLRCAVNLFNRAQAPNGFLMQIGNDAGTGGSTTLRVALDPLVDVWPLLGTYGVHDLGFA